MLLHMVAPPGPRTVNRTVTRTPHGSVVCQDAASIDDEYSRRMRSLLSVDDLVLELHDTLVELKEWENTFVIFSSVTSTPSLPRPPPLGPPWLAFALALSSFSYPPPHHCIRLTLLCLAHSFVSFFLSCAGSRLFARPVPVRPKRWHCGRLQGCIISLVPPTQHPGCRPTRCKCTKTSFAFRS